MKYVTATLIEESPKFNSVTDVVAEFDFVLDLIRIDVENILQKKANFKYQNFDDFFHAAAQKLKFNLKNKTHLNGIQKLLNSDSKERFVRSLIVKLVGMIKNEYVPERANSLITSYKKFEKIETSQQNQPDPLDTIILREEEQIKSIEKEKNMFDYKQNLKEIVNIEKSQSGHNQLTFFDKNFKKKEKQWKNFTRTRKLKK